MIGYYPYVVVALLLIYTHSTDQKLCTGDPAKIQKVLREEKTGSGNIPREKACDLTLEKKKQLCEYVMCEYTIGRDPGDGPQYGRGEFLKGKTTLAVSPLVNRDDPYACKPIPVDGLDMEKPMYWCPHRMYKKLNADTIQAKGFFISSGLKEVNTAIMFRPSETNEGTVDPYYMIEDVNILSGRAN